MATLRRMTLPEALTFAHEHQPALRAALARVVEQREEAKVPSGQWLPLVGVTAQLLGGTANNTTASYLTPSFMDVPRIGGTTVTVPGSLKPYPVDVRRRRRHAGGLRLRAHLRASGRRRRARRGRKSTRLDRAARHRPRRRGGLLRGVRGEGSPEGFRGRVRARQGPPRSRQSRASTSGLRSPIELTRAEADLARFDIGRIRARGGLTVAQTVLAAAIGAPEVGRRRRGRSAAARARCRRSPTPSSEPRRATRASCRRSARAQGGRGQDARHRRRAPAGPGR